MDRSNIVNRVGLGLQVGCQMGVETGAFSLSVIMMGWLGGTGLAAHQVAGVITTLGEQGSVINNGEGGTVGIAAPKTVADPTGAGDSFRSGLLKGLLHGLDVLASARLGATCASYCIEHQGTQEHVFTYEDFAARHRAAFHEEPGGKW